MTKKCDLGRSCSPKWIEELQAYVPSKRPGEAITHVEVMIPRTNRVSVRMEKMKNMEG
jgi:hypothetical protein